MNRVFALRSTPRRPFWRAFDARSARGVFFCDVHTAANKMRLLMSVCQGAYCREQVVAVYGLGGVAIHSRKARLLNIVGKAVG